MALGTSAALPNPPISMENLDVINAHLNPLTPEQILQWGIQNLPDLHQTTAFGLTGLVAIDMLSKITSTPPPLIFIDTLYHFPETYELVDEVKKKYNALVHVYKPEGCSTVDEFEKRYGQRLWETDEDMYDYVVKVRIPENHGKLLRSLYYVHSQVEPAQRAYTDLGVKSVITGRRASQGADRASLQPLEIDSTGLLKLNPLCSWDFHLVESYVKENSVPRNRLLHQGYRSVGDWHSTVRVTEGQDERAGRWAGKEKTECGLHKDYFIMKDKASHAGMLLFPPDA
jgi:phosphoadenosine phosphosulfate reductase